MSRFLVLTKRSAASGDENVHYRYLYACAYVVGYALKKKKNLQCLDVGALVMKSLTYRLVSVLKYYVS